MTKPGPELIARLNKFDLRARQIVEGFMIGLHKSPYHGFSVEFSDHRAYNPGDDPSGLDWKVYARTGKYYVKRFEQETNLKSYLVVDHSLSMGFGQPQSKLLYAQQLASALAYLMVTQQDAVGLAAFSDTITSYLPPRAMRGYLTTMWEHLALLEPSGKTSSVQVLHKLAELLKRRGLVVIITDLLDEPAQLLAGLRHLRHNRHEVILFHLSDPQEEQFAYKREAEFIDAETGDKLVLTPWQVRQAYLKVRQQHIEEIKTKCYEARVEYNPITTSTPFDEALMVYLNKRSRLG